MEPRRACSRWLAPAAHAAAAGLAHDDQSRGDVPRIDVRLEVPLEPAVGDVRHAERAAPEPAVLALAREEPVDGVSARIISDSVPGIEFLDRSNAEIVNEMRRRLGPKDATH